MSHGFATKPEDLEKFCGLESGGEETATIDDFLYVEKVCAQYQSKIVRVIDAEGETVCFAPIDIAKLISKLLNECDAFD